MFNILVLEDDQNQFELYQQALKDDELEDKYRLIHVTSVVDAQNKIDSNTINAGIFDLKVPKSVDSKEATVEDGVEYLKSLLKTKQFPVIVVSANSGNIDREDSSFPKHLIVKDRSAGVHSEVFKEFAEKEGLLQISPLFSKANKEIEVNLKNSFWEFWGNWKEPNVFFDDDEEEVKSFLKRYVCSYLLEKWMENDLFNEVHHTEFYIHQHVRDRVYTGDILNLEDNPNLEDDCWIVMTAPCNLSNDNYPENLTLLKCEPIDPEVCYKLVIPCESEASKGKQIKKIGKCFTDPSVSKHYLPPWKKGGLPAYVLFKQIKTISFAEDKRDQLKDKRVASLSFHFLPSLLQRYGAYVSRIGQPNMNVKAYHTYLSSVVSEENTS